MRTPDHLNNSTQAATPQITVVVQPTESAVLPQETVIEVIQEVPVVAQEQTINQREANVTLNPVNCEQYRHLVEQYDWNVSVALAVMKAESGCNTEASNWADSHSQCDGSFGLFQLACFWTDTPHDPTANVAKAYEIYSDSGWSPWGAFTNGAYLRYL